MESSSIDYITFYISPTEEEEFLNIHCFDSRVDEFHKYLITCVYGLTDIMNKIQKKYDSYNTTVIFRMETSEEIEKLLTRYGRK